MHSRTAILPLAADHLPGHMCSVPIKEHVSFGRRSITPRNPPHFGLRRAMMGRPAAVLFIAGMVGANIPPPSPSPPPPAQSPRQPPAVPAPPTQPPYPPTAPMTCQWATSATASSQYSATCNKGSSQHACETTGPPDVAPSCADTSGAWSTSTSAATAEWLQVTFGGGLLQLYRVTIYETYRAPFVTKVEAFLDPSNPTTIWQGTDETSCGSSLELSFPAGVVADKLKIWTLVSGFEQIDAVQACGVVVPYPPSSPPTPPAPPAAPPPCSSQVDVVLVLDNSGSVGAQRPEVLNFARDVVGAFTMSATAAQIAYVEFETTTVTHAQLTPSLTTILTAIDNAPAVGAGTFLSGGIDLGQSVVTGAGARAGVPKVMILMSDGVQTVGGDDNTAIGSATLVKNAGTKILAVGFGGVSVITLNAIASSPSSEYARYETTAAAVIQMITNGEFDFCKIATDMPRGPPPSPPNPPWQPSPSSPSPVPPPPPVNPPVDCDYCSDLNTAYQAKEAELKLAGACPSGAIADTDGSGTSICKMWVDGRMWFVPRE